MTSPIKPESSAVERYRKTMTSQPKKSVAVDRYRAAKAEADRDPNRTAVSNFGRGFSTGLAETGTDATEGVGWAVSKIPRVDDAGERIKQFGENQAAQARDFYDPQGFSGKAGMVAGRIIGETASTLAGGGLIRKGLQKFASTSKAAKAIEIGRKGNFVQRTAANTLPFAPADFVMGAGAADEGERLKGGTTNLLYGIGGATAIEAATDAVRGVNKLNRIRKATVDAPAPESMGPHQARKMLPERAGSYAGDAQLGPAIPMKGRVELPKLPEVKTGKLGPKVPPQLIEKEVNTQLGAIERSLPLTRSQRHPLRKQIRADVKNRYGHIDPALMSQIAGAGTGAAVGAAVDDENRLRGAFGGAAIGAGVGYLGSRAISSGIGGKARPSYLMDPAIAKVANSISKDAGTLSGPIDIVTGAKRTYTKLVDQVYPLRDFGRKLGGSDALSDEAARATGWKGIAEAKVRTDFKKVLETVKGHEDGVATLAKAERALELLDAGLEKTDIPRVDLEATVAKLSQIPEVKAGADAIRGYYRSLLDSKLANGVIDQATYAQIRETGQMYVPFVRDFAGDIKPPTAGGGKLFNRGTGIRKMKDAKASAKTVDPFEQAILDTYEAERTIAKQRVSNVLTDIVEADPTGAAPFIRKLGKDEIAKSGHVVEANIRGSRQRYEVLDKDLYDAWASLDPQQRGVFQKLLSIPKTTLRVGVTMVPDFALTNAIRDNVQAAIQYFPPPKSMAGSALAGGTVGALTNEEDRLHGFLQGAGFGLSAGALAPTAIRWGRGFAASIGRTDDWLEWMREGGAGFSDFYARPKDAQALIKQLSREEPGFLESIQTPRGVWDAIARVGQAAEEGTRIGRYLEGKNIGETPTQAMSASRDISLDFSRIGRDPSVKTMANLTAFWNAKIQGWDKLARMLADPKKIGMGAATLTAPSIALWSINKDNPEYWKRPQWERNVFWLIPLPENPMGWHFAKIPKPFELGFLFASLPERFLDYMYEKDPETAQYALRDMLSTTTDGTFPLPTGVQPLVENAVNHSFFTNRPIVGRGLERLPNEMQYDNRTSSAAVGLGQLTGASPQKIDNIIRGYTGSAGAMALDATSRLARKAGLDQRPAPPSGKPPFIGRFLTSDTQTSDAEETVRRRFEASERAINGAKELDERGDYEGLQRFIRKNAAVLASYDDLKARTRELAEVNRARREIVDDPTMTPTQKREAMAFLARESHKIASRGLTEEYAVDQR